jgi:TIR domain-containing protein
MRGHKAQPKKPNGATANKRVSSVVRQESAQWDFFISHASEDKQAIARPLADALLAMGIRVWYDDFSLAVGDSLRDSIDRGLTHSKFGIVILSRHFFAKHWPQKELNGLANLEVDGRRVILPVWHKIGAQEMRSYSPMLADRIAVTTDNPLEHVVEKLLRAAGLVGPPNTKTRRGKTATRGLTELRAKSTGPPNSNFLAMPISAVSSAFDEKPKRGRTIPDNFLLGSRNAWVGLLEESWPEIGWPLSCIRDQRNGTLEDIRTLFEPAKEKPHNPGLAAAFYHPSAEIASPSDVLRNNSQLGKLDAGILQVQAECDGGRRLCQEAEAALKVANSADAEGIKDEASRREQRLLVSQQNLQKLKSERDALGTKLRDQEAYVFRFQLLDFLLSGRPPVNPRTVANVVAGLPRMGWRQSLARCSPMPFDPPRLEYSVFELLSEVWEHRLTDFEVPPIDFLRDEILKLPEKRGYRRQFLWDNWRDLSKAIDECWRSPSPRPVGSIPFALTSIFMRNVARQKDPAERILADRDKLMPLKSRGGSARLS